MVLISQKADSLPEINSSCCTPAQETITTRPPNCPIMVPRVSPSGINTIVNGEGNSQKPLGLDAVLRHLPLCYHVGIC